MRILREKGWGGVKGGEIKSAAGRDCGGSGRGGRWGGGGGYKDSGKRSLFWRTQDSGKLTARWVSFMV